MLELALTRRRMLVSVDLTVATARQIDVYGRVARRARRAERRRLASQDRHSAMRAELHCMRALVEQAIPVVAAGWVQHSWFEVTDAKGQSRMVTGHNIGEVTSHPVAGACLVGALVHAAGGPSVVRSQLVQRTLDLTWHTLFGDERQPVRWCPPPATRMANVRDLTAWNDHPSRSADDVEALLRSTARNATVQAQLSSER